MRGMVRKEVSSSDCNVSIIGASMMAQALLANSNGVAVVKVREEAHG